MAWTTPASYTASEVVTASKLNVHVRDNTRYLKDVLDGVQTQTVTPRYAAADAVGPSVVLGKARGASLAAPAIVSASDSLGTIGFAGYDGSAYREAAQIKAFVDGTPGASDMPGALSFLTSADGGITLAERARVNAAGQLLFSDGTLALPGLAFLTDPDTGLQRVSANVIGMVTGGARTAQFDAGGLKVQGGSTVLPGLSFQNAQDTGLYDIGTGIGFAVDGSAQMLLTGAGLALTGAMTINGTRINAGCRVYHSAAQSIATGTNVALAFNSERYDSDGFHDTVINNNRLTVPAGMGGKYLIFAHVEWAANTDATARILQLRVNNAAYIALDSRPAIATAAITTRHTISTVYDLAAGDYMEIVVHQLAAGAVNITAAGNFTPEFGMQLIG